MVRLVIWDAISLIFTSLPWHVPWKATAYRMKSGAVSEHRRIFHVHNQQQWMSTMPLIRKGSNCRMTTGPIVLYNIFIILTQPGSHQQCITAPLTAAVSSATEVPSPWQTAVRSHPDGLIRGPYSMVIYRAARSPQHWLMVRTNPVWEAADGGHRGRLLGAG